MVRGQVRVPTFKATQVKHVGSRVGLLGFMPPPRGSVQIDRGGPRSGVFGALQAPATKGAQSNWLSAFDFSPEEVFFLSGFGLHC
jgi:hypothetical protein